MVAVIATTDVITQTRSRSLDTVQWPSHRRYFHAPYFILLCFSVRTNLNFLLRLQAMKAFIEANFRMIDIDSDGVIGAKEYRYNCITRVAVESIQVVDDAFNKLLDVNVSFFSTSESPFSQIASYFVGRTKIGDGVA